MCEYLFCVRKSTNNCQKSKINTEFGDSIHQNYVEFGDSIPQIHTKFGEYIHQI